MTLNRRIYLTLISVFIAGMLNAQPLELGIQEALNLAEKNNFSNKQAATTLEQAKASYRMSNAVFLPGIELSNTAVTTNDPLSSFGFKLKQEVVTQADFAPSLLNDPGNIENYNTKIELKQPVLNIDGIYARKASKNQLDAMKFQTERVKNNINFEVKKAYYMLELAESSVQVLQKSVKTAEDALRLTKDNEEQGFVKHADVLEASVRLNERQNQLLEVQNQYEMANDYLAHLLGLDLNTNIHPTDSLVVPASQILFDTNRVEISNRSDLQSYQKQIEAGENMVRSNKMAFVPRINAFGAVEWNDNKFFGTGANNYMLGASLSWNIFNGYKNIGVLQKSKAQLAEAEYGYNDYLSQSKMQVNNVVRAIKLAYSRIESGRVAREQARESLRIRTNRFKQGLEKTTDLLMAETLASQKELEFIQSVYNYKKAVFELEFLTEKNINN